MDNQTLSLILQIVVSLSTLIPLVIELVKYVRLSIKEKNWKNMLDLALNLMAEAEQKFACGADRRDWVISMLRASANTINYDMDEEQLGNLIDSVIALTKKVNVVEETEVKTVE